MEPAVLTEMLEFLHFVKKTSVSDVVIDDDSKMPKQARWSNEDYTKNYSKPAVVITEDGKQTKRKEGSLNSKVQERRFVADPAH